MKQAPGLAHWIEKRVYVTGDRLIPLSDAFARILVEQYGIDKQRIRVIPGGIDATRFDCGLSREDARRRLGWPTDRPIVLCVRRLARRMGLANLIAAAAELRSRHPDLLVLIAGKGHEEHQILGLQRLKFSDADIARQKLLARLEKGA